MQLRFPEGLLICFLTCSFKAVYSFVVSVSLWWFTGMLSKEPSNSFGKNLMMSSNVTSLICIRHFSERKYSTWSEMFVRTWYRSVQDYSYIRVTITHLLPVLALGWKFLLPYSGSWTLTDPYCQWSSMVWIEWNKLVVILYKISLIEWSVQFWSVVSGDGVLQKLAAVVLTGVLKTQLKYRTVTFPPCTSP